MGMESFRAGGRGWRGEGRLAEKHRKPVRAERPLGRGHHKPPGIERKLRACGGWVGHCGQNLVDDKIIGPGQGDGIRGGNDVVVQGIDPVFNCVRILIRNPDMVPVLAGIRHDGIRGPQVIAHGFFEHFLEHVGQQ